MSRRIATIGDIHATWRELEELYSKLSWLSLDEIWHLGDTCDRGEHSGKTIEFLRKNNIKGVRGNHDDSIINHWDRVKRGGPLPRMEDKRRTISEISQEDVDYLDSLPYLHVIDDLNLVLVHAGLWPSIPLYAQPSNVCRVQMVHPDHPGKTAWFGEDSIHGPLKKTEEELVRLGWRRWYHVYDHEQTVIFGHSTFYQPMIYQREGYGQCIGVDCGSSFGGSLTACIYSESEPFFVSVKNKKVYCESTTRQFWEAQ